MEVSKGQQTEGTPSALPVAFRGGPESIVTLMNDNLPRLALFIDADNICLQLAPGIIDCLSASWDVCYRRAYGLNLLNNEEVLRKYSIVPVEVLNNTPGKNSTDFALVIDAMEEVCLGHSDAICVVSADGDFTRLIQRARERGKSAIIFGKATTAAALRSACSEFHAIEDFRATQNATEKVKSPKKPAPSAETKPRAESEAAVRNGLRQVFRNLSADREPVTLERFGQFLKECHPKLAPPKFGLSRLKPFLERIGGFKIQPIAKGDGIAGKFRVTLPSPE
jgi:NYN domain